MKISIISLFPEMFNGPFEYSIVKRAIKTKLISIKLINLRDFAVNKHNKVDNYPYGGGAGMVMMPEPIVQAVEYIKKQTNKENVKIIILSPAGKLFKQKDAVEFSLVQHLILICGHYEGIDERVKIILDANTYSIGDYILTGGELPAMVIIDSIARLVPGVLGSKKSIDNESFNNNYLEYPQYTRPREYLNEKVPAVLLSGNHEQIKKWRVQESKKITKELRPDLLDAKEEINE